MINSDFNYTEIVGNSEAVKNKLIFIHKFAKSNKNVLILGETGTGKNVTAKKIHEMSDRKNKPFISINCINIPEELFESELFGCARGSFTGAIRDKQGLLEVGKDGTIYFDEIGDISLYLQSKLLRVIEEREIRRIGETVSRRISSRFIFATNKNLYKEVKAGNFRKDLYYRINVLRLCIPPLRERKEDIPLLVSYILNREKNKDENPKRINQGAIRKLMAYDFPGNIRELENIIERACVLSDGAILGERDIIFDHSVGGSKESINITPESLKKTLEYNRWNKSKAAIEIGTSRRHLYRLLKKYRMDKCIRENCVL